MNDYATFVADFARLLAQGNQYQLGGFPPAPRPHIPANAPKALIFSPHPDDEAIVGGLALRLSRESRLNVINVAVTQGSNKARQPARWQELSGGCDYLGIGLLATRPNGLEGIGLKQRNQNPTAWNESVARITEILLEQKPQVIFFPHAEDWNSTHIGTHYLVADALARAGNGFACYTVETEFWGAMDDPNLMVESSSKDVGDLITALSFHVGEVRRNPYHLRLPAWMMDNVRRGGELVGGQGGAAPSFPFATLYRLRAWRDGEFRKVYEGGKILSQAENPATLFPAF